MNTLETFKKYTEELQHLGNVLAVLNWDMETRMPKNGAKNRGQQVGLLAKLNHQMWTHDKLGNMLRTLEGQKDTLPGKYDRGLVRYIGREYDRATKIPESLVEEMSATETEAHHVWVDARKTNDFSKFSPYLEKIVDQKKRYAEAVGYTGSPYNALLDIYEPGLTTEQLDPLFADLKKELVPLIKGITQSATQLTKDAVKGRFDVNQQRDLARQLLVDMGFDLDNVRLEDVPHPCCSGTGPGDLAIGNRYFEDDVLSGIYSLMHEGGHGLYDEGIDPEIASSPLSGGASLGIHESQSRLWENLVGRSKPFSEFLLKRLNDHFPGQLPNLTAEELYKAMNISKPSLIRVEADEATYNLHVMLRYEIECDMIEGKLAVKDVPQAWNQKMQDYFGITPPTDTEGCLQDVHWSMGGLGYFPTYTLGNLYSVQFFNEAKKQLPTLENDMRQGNLKPLKTWLNQQIHRSSKAELPSEIVQRVTGEPLNAKYFVAYLKDKFSQLYGLSAPVGAGSAGTP